MKLYICSDVLLLQFFILCLFHLHLFVLFSMKCILCGHFMLLIKPVSGALGGLCSVVVAFSGYLYERFMNVFQQLQKVHDELPQEQGFSAGPLEDDCKFFLEFIQGSLFIMRYFASIRMNHIISELCYKGT